MKLELRYYQHSVLGRGLYQMPPAEPMECIKEVLLSYGLHIITITQNKTPTSISRFLLFFLCFSFHI